MTSVNHDNRSSVRCRRDPCVVLRVWTMYHDMRSAASEYKKHDKYDLSVAKYRDSKLVFDLDQSKQTRVTNRVLRRLEQVLYEWEGSTTVP